jgi:hypothetical protein
MVAGALALVLAAPAPSPQPPANPPADLLAGIALVRDGDFEGAVLKLDGAIRAMEAAPRPPADLSTAYLYLGVAYLELDQEMSARARFRQALAKDPALRLDPRQFSPQVIRVFDATRAEGPGAPAPSPTPRATATAPPVSAAPPAGKKGSKKPLLFLLLGGGAAAAGVAAAAGGGGGGTSVPATVDTPTTVPGVGGGTTTTTVAPAPTTTAPGPTPTTTTLPGPTTTTVPTPTTTTTMRPSCSYQMRGPNPGNPYPAGPVPQPAGSCTVETSGGCAWTVTAPGNPWIQIQGASGTGTGSVNFTLGANTTTSARTGSISVSGESASCEIRQSGILGASAEGGAPEGATFLTSTLSLEGGTGQVVVNAAQVFYQAPGSLRAGLADSGPRRVVATVVTSAGRPGEWRFHLASGPAGHLRVLAGDVAVVTPDTVVFRLSGRAGERLVFLAEGP